MYFLWETWQPRGGYIPLTRWWQLKLFSRNLHPKNLGMVPLKINPIYTLYSGYLLDISPFKGLLGGLKQLGYHQKTFKFHDSQFDRLVLRLFSPKDPYRDWAPEAFLFFSDGIGTQQNPSLDREGCLFGFLGQD